MKSGAASFLIFFVVSAPAFGQRGPQIPPPTNLVAPNIPGVVAGGTPIQMVKTGFDRAEGPVAMPDGGILFTGRNTINRIDPGGNASTFVEESNGANGLGFDAKGRLIAVERGAGGSKVGVLYPPESKTVLADSYEGKPLGVELPATIDLRVVQTDPGMPSATVSNVLKPAKLETGLVVGVPHFVQEGEVIRVDTTEGKYLERVRG